MAQILIILKSFLKIKLLKNTELDKNKINIIFVAEHITSKVKNYQLAKAAMKFLPKNYVLYPITGLKHNELINYYNAADMLLLTSFSEGSPNVIKEAMACNCPIVSTDVGDVKQVIKYTENCYNCNFEPQDIAEKITKVANLQSRSNGRDNIKNLDANLIAKKLCNLYKECL